MHRRFFAPVLAVLLAVALVSCASLSMSKAGKQATPDSHVLVFGSITYRQGLLMITRTPSLMWTQVNPDAAALQAQPAVDGDLFFVAPRPLGESWDLHSYTIRAGNSRVTHYLGMNGKGTWDFRTEKPGLLYVGCYQYQEGKLFSDDYGGMRPSEKPTELELLKMLVSHFTKTPWEPVIQARIEELSR
jgi:hypothetical protein